MSDRTIILRHGAIVETGATEKVFDNPQHDYTRMLLSSVPELHKKWQHTPLGPVAGSGNGHVASLSVMDDRNHAEQVVKRDLRAVLGGSRAVSSGKSAVALTLEPPALHEFEPDHLVAEPE